MSDASKSRSIGAPRLALMVLVPLATAMAIYALRGAISLERAVEWETQLRAWRDQAPVATYAAAFVLYVLVTALSLPFALVMTLAYAWLFSFWPAVLLLSFASTAGATLAFLLSRYLIGDWIQRRYAERLATLNAWFAEQGPLFLFWLRLVPTVPFFVVNLVMGLTAIPTHTFWWVSQIGMLPGTCVYCYAGASVPSLRVLQEQGLSGILRPEVAVAFLVLGAFPWAARSLQRRWRRRGQR